MSADRVLPNEGAGSSKGPPSDKELVQEFLGGNHRAFEVLYGRYQQTIFRYLARLVGDQALAEEIFQEVFLHLFRRASRFDRSKTFRSWFFRVAHNRAMDFLRKDKGRGRVEELDEEAVGAGAGLSVEQRALESESAGILDLNLQKLSEEHRSVLLLKFKEDLTYEEIAEVVGCPVGTAKSRVHHAIRHLRELMGKQK